MSKDTKRCGINSRTIGACDLEWGHDGDEHANSGDGFYAQDHDGEHHRRQRARKRRRDGGGA